MSTAGYPYWDDKHAVQVAFKRVSLAEACLASAERDVEEAKRFLHHRTQQLDAVRAVYSKYYHAEFAKRAAALNAEEGIFDD